MYSILNRELSYFWPPLSADCVSTHKVESDSGSVDGKGNQSWLDYTKWKIKEPADLGWVVGSSDSNHGSRCWRQIITLVYHRSQCWYLGRGDDVMLESDSDLYPFVKLLSGVLFPFNKLCDFIAWESRWWASSGSFNVVRIWTCRLKFYFELNRSDLLSFW